MADILLVDDDPHLREVVRYALAREGHTVREASDGLKALAAFEAAPPDMLVLDVLMPELDGLEVCRRIRKTSAVPILFLSSRGEEVDRVMGLDLGGDDYLTKPFSTRELVSRVRAVLRRVAPTAESASGLEHGPVRIDPAGHRAFVGADELTLTVTEFRMLQAFVKHPGRAFARSALVGLAYDGPHHVSDRTVDSHIRNLRAKLRDAGADGLIETVHGIGFRMTEAPLMRLSSLLPVLPLRAWLGFSYLAVLTFPVAAVLATGALGRDLVNQTRWDLEHQAALVAMLAGNEVEGARRVAPAATLPDLTAELSEHLRQAKAETLSGYRVVDAQGRVVATSGTGESLGDSLASDVEVRQALAGRAAVKIRPREAVRNVPLGGQSRRADVRVFVAYPIEVHGEVLGAVVVSRTPREELQALYQMAPSGLLVGAVFALLVTAMFAWFSADILSRSLRSLAIGSRRIAEGHFDGLEQLAAPKGSHLREVGEASRNVEAMAVRLRDRLAYIGEFASNVSHEFKTPLSTLKGTLELLGDDPDMDPAQRQRFLTNASESVDRLERMVTGLLSLARAEEGGSAEPIELDGLVRAVAARFDAPVEGRAGRVSGDPAQLETVLVNLLQNARVHGGAARVEAFVAEGATGFAVIDDGPGISASNLDKVFDRFFTTNRGGGSSGLGLALVRAIAFTHGGDVAVRSRPGETVFTVTLPGAEVVPGMARQSFVKAFIASVLGTGLSRVLGLVRDVVIGNYLGAGATADAFWMAWTVPNAFRRFVADEGLTGALVPGIARAEAEEGTARAQTLANRVLTALLLVNAGIVALGVAFPEALVYAFAYGFTDDPEKYALTVGMTQVLMPFLTMVSIVSFFEGLLNHRGHFFVPKVAPGLVSAGIAGVAVLFANAFDEPAWALVAGVWVGGIAHILIHLPWTRRLWGPVGLDFGFRGDRFQVVVRELGKVVVIGLFAQVNILVLRQMASFMMDGAVSRYTYATRLVDLAQGIIAVAIGSALLPNISTAVANADWDRFRSDLTGAFRLAAFLLVPAAVGLFVYAVPLTSLVFLRGRFTLDDVTWTATCLQLMTPFMLGVAGVNIVKKVFFALEERNSLLVVGAIGVVVTGVVGYLLMGMDINGLAIALSIATVSQLAMYLAILRLRLGDRMPLFELLVPLAKMIAASVPLALFAFWAASHGVWSEGLTASNLGWFVLGIVGGAALYGVAAWLLGIGELRAITSRLTARLRR